MASAYSIRVVRSFCVMWLSTFFTSVGEVAASSPEVQFNTDVLDLKDRENIDLSQFSRKGYILPGRYSLAVNINSTVIPERLISFKAPVGNPKGSEACLTVDLVSQMGLTNDATKGLEWTEGESCLVGESLPGLEIRPDLGTSTLYLSVPQAWLEYSSPDWDPPLSVGAWPARRNV